MIHNCNNVCWDTVIRGRDWSREPTQGIHIFELFPSFVSDGILICRGNNCTSNDSCGSHVRDSSGLTKQGFQRLVVRFNGKVSTDEVAMKLLHCEDDGQGFFL